MSALFHCVVRAKPVPQGRARVPRFGKPYYPKTSTAHRKVLWAAFYQERCETELVEIDYPVSITVEVSGGRANSDLTNHLKMVEDALVEAGVLSSDDVRVVAEITGRLIVGDPRTEVTIRTIDVHKPGVSRRPKQEKTK